MRIAIDAMGGDFAPQEIVAGVVDAVRSLSGVGKVFLVGRQDAVEAELAKHSGFSREKIEVRYASEVVGMDESPAAAIRRKKDSSIGRAVDLVKAGEADAVFSAGNTGAVVAATTLKLRTLEGVERPAIATVFPTPVKPFVLLDAGANTDCTPEMLYQFAVMGCVYSREILGRARPTVGLLNIGGEEAKGNEATKEAFKLLEASKLDFRGNVESRDLFEGKVDVVASDGFVGNVVLKTSESVAHAIGHWLREEFTRNPIRMLGAVLLSRGLKSIKDRSDPAMYGGAPLLGVNGICIIGHGSSSARAVRNAIRVACESVKHSINHLIVDEVRLSSGGAS
ncbi:MAG: phosphate acyltransferase PlsX [Kiritimatiellae bacterium]|nr:phosphate acyltransferase PlsX [Kiritimatiellia bacterium]